MSRTTVAERQWRAAQARLEELDRALLRALARGYDEVIRELEQEVRRALRRRSIDPERLDRIERYVRQRLEELEELATRETERSRIEAAQRALDDVRAYIDQIQRQSPYPFQWAEPWASAEVSSPHRYCPNARTSSWISCFLVFQALIGTVQTRKHSSVCSPP